MRILVPVDPKDASFAAASAAAIRLSGPDDEVHVLHLEPTPIDWYSGPGSSEISKKHLEKAKESLQAAVARHGLTGATVTVARDDAAGARHVGEDIVAFAQKIEADLIVIPTHGRKGFTRLVLGSVAESVVRLAHCDVYIVRIPREE